MSSRPNWKITITICRTWNLPCRKVNSGFLQTRNGNVQVPLWCASLWKMLHQGMIDEKTALMRCRTQQAGRTAASGIRQGRTVACPRADTWFAASPGAACGRIVFFAEDAAEWHTNGHRVVLVRIETSPEDLSGMQAAEGILTAVEV